MCIINIKNIFIRYYFFFLFNRFYTFLFYRSVQYGRDMEDEAKTKFKEKFGNTIEKCGLLIDTQIPYLAASPGLT